MAGPHPSARRRAIISLATGLVVGVAVKAIGGAWEVAVLAGWDIAAVVLVGWVMSQVWGRDAEGTRALATREDDSRVAADAMLLTASVISLVGVGFGLVKAAHAKGLTQAGITAVTILTVVLGWAVVQTVYTLRYAHLYYTGDQPGGVEFNYEHPDYRDFAHLGLTIGMTYQVADTDLTDRAFRRTVTCHALLSYLFGVVVVAMTINAVAGLLNK